jgi:hypothetical protein
MVPYVVVAGRQGMYPCAWSLQLGLGDAAGNAATIFQWGVFSLQKNLDPVMVAFCFIW